VYVDYHRKLDMRNTKQDVAKDKLAEFSFAKEIVLNSSPKLK
jgi:hypothetical protein